MYTFLKRRVGGFTLVEILVAIAIIGLLSAVILTSLNKVRANARDGKRITDMKQLELAVQLYKEAQTSYPAEGGSLLVSELSGVAPTFIPALPSDPRPVTTGDDGEYRYALVGTTGFVLVSSIESRGSVNYCYVTSSGVDPTSDLPNEITSVYGTPGIDADFVDCGSL